MVSRLRLPRRRRTGHDPRAWRRRSRRANRAVRPLASPRTRFATCRCLVAGFLVFLGVFRHLEHLVMDVQNLEIDVGVGLDVAHLLLAVVLYLLNVPLERAVDLAIQFIDFLEPGADRLVDLRDVVTYRRPIVAVRLLLACHCSLHKKGRPHNEAGVVIAHRGCRAAVAPDTSCGSTATSFERPRSIQSVRRSLVLRGLCGPLVDQVFSELLRCGYSLSRTPRPATRICSRPRRRRSNRPLSARVCARIRRRP